MQEIVVISGKGGTGKTSLVASFASLAKNVVLADCDADASNLHFVVDHMVTQRTNFSGGKRAAIDAERCLGCGDCVDLCRFDAIRVEAAVNGDRSESYHIDPIACEGCGVCAWFCPAEAIDFKPAINGQWFVSSTRYGSMVHAKLGVAEENLGKLVGVVRAQARLEAEKHEVELILTDGSPGIGCPVIASLTGADLVVIVTEASLSGLHDLERVADVAKHLAIPTLVCINKWDINTELTSLIESAAQRRKIPVVGRVRYDRVVTEAQIKGRSIVDYTSEGCAQDIRQVWASIESQLLQH